MKKQQEDLSRFMSYALRHNPEGCGLKQNTEGYCPLSSLLEAVNCKTKWKDATLDDLLHVVTSCEKQRFEVLDNQLIRARYGHSKGDISYGAPSAPPACLLHGTNEQALTSIMQEGLDPRSRKYVHLSETPVFASLAGQRRGELVLIEVDTQKALTAGVTFYYGGGEVWLSSAIPADCLMIFKRHD